MKWYVVWEGLEWEMERNQNEQLSHTFKYNKMAFVKSKTTDPDPF